MNDVDQIIEIIKAKGFKNTPIRKSILESLNSTTNPLAITDIEKRLEQVDLTPNKTTLYREIAFLMEQGIVQEVDFGEGKKRYEIDTQEHHHHIICIKCKKVEDVSLEQDLSVEEKRIAKAKNYQILNHSLEFFGICANCQTL